LIKRSQSSIKELKNRYCSSMY